LERPPFTPQDRGAQADWETALDRGAKGQRSACRHAPTVVAIYASVKILTEVLLRANKVDEGFSAPQISHEFTFMHGVFVAVTSAAFAHYYGCLVPMRSKKADRIVLVGPTSRGVIRVATERLPPQERGPDMRIANHPTSDGDDICGMCICEISRWHVPCFKTGC